MNYTNCPHCGGKLRAESIGWKCEKCQGFIDMQGNFHEHVEKPFMPPMTIADRIRAMNDDELRNFLCGLMNCSGCVFGSASGCKLKDWLQMPSKEE